MALRNIVTQGDPILNKKCRPVTEFDEKLANLLDDMFETMHNANGVGLAGPQVGILRRVVVIDAEDEDIELVNPEIVSVSDETQTGLEGCLSLPGRCARPFVRRIVMATGMNMRAKNCWPGRSCMRSTISTAISIRRSRRRC